MQRVQIQRFHQENIQQNMCTVFGIIDAQQDKKQEHRRIMRKILKNWEHSQQQASISFTFTIIHFSFLQIEQFWSVYNHMVRPNDLPNTADYHMFKKGIKPMWEVCFLSSESFIIIFIYFFYFFFIFFFFRMMRIKKVVNGLSV